MSHVWAYSRQTSCYQKCNLGCEDRAGKSQLTHWFLSPSNVVVHCTAIRHVCGNFSNSVLLCVWCILVRVRHVSCRRSVVSSNDTGRYIFERWITTSSDTNNCWQVYLEIYPINTQPRNRGNWKSKSIYDKTVTTNIVLFIKAYCYKQDYIYENSYK